MGHRTASVPVHRRVSADLRAAMDAGTYADGTRLPTEAELADEYGVSRQTVRRAFQDLVADGLVRRVPGQGTFPVDPAGNQRYARSVGSIEDLLQWSDSEMEVHEAVGLRNDAGASELLGLPDGVVAHLAVRRFFEGQPFALSRIFLPPAVATRLVAEDAISAGAGTVIAAVEHFLGGDVARVQQEITAVTIPDDLVETLEAHPGEPALRVKRRFFDSDDRCVELAITHYNARRYAYRLELRERR